MRKDQSTFAERVADLGLERGIEGSKATHQRINAHYSAIENVSKDVPRITVDELKPKKIKGETLAEKIFGAKETDLGVAHRLTAKIKGYAEPLAKTAAIASQNAQKAKEYQETAKNMRNQLNGIKEPFKGLNREQMTEIMTLAVKYRMENERAQKNRTQSKAQSRDNPGQDRGR
jgi:predicted nucleotidyltransferase